MYVCMYVWMYIYIWTLLWTPAKSLQELTYAITKMSFVRPILALRNNRIDLGTRGHFNLKSYRRKWFPAFHCDRVGNPPRAPLPIHAKLALARA